MKEMTKKHLLFGALIFLAFSFFYFVLPSLFPLTYDVNDRSIKATVANSTKKGSVDKVKITPIIASHISTPDPVKAIYISSWVAGTGSLMQKLIDLVDTTELNAVVIDVKDSTGLISFHVNDLTLKAYGSESTRIADIDSLIALLHQKNIYVIGRVAAFQDPYMVKLHPEFAVKKISDGGVWKDRKGISWIDAGAKGNWDYLISIGKEAYDRGFDEINYDYIRYPTDGNMQDISYPYSSGKIRHEVMRNFFVYIATSLRSTGPKISADLFGLTTIASDDVGIGQILGDALLSFDYVAPMVYPSHFYAGTNGFKNPAEHPYEIIKYSMSSGIAKAKMASSSPSKLRPWLQAFDLGAIYTSEMVRSQIQATYDVGLNSWMLWDAANKYTTAKGTLNRQ